MISFLYVLFAILGLSFLIFIHELGHYWMARRVGMRVEVFAIGFGKPIYQWEKDGVKWKAREGAVFVDITSARGKNEYDWDNKITFALSVNDLGKLIYGLRTNNEDYLSLIHDPGAKSASAGKVRKHINFTSPNGPAEGYILSVTMVVGKDKRTHTVPLKPDEVLIIGTLFQTAVSKALAW